jgi:cytochrome c-type biogenesis protein
MIHDVSIPAALIAGIVSFLSPCVLPLVPPYLIYLTGATIEHVATGEQTAASKRAVMLSALTFVFGLSTVFIALGAGASVIGGLIRAWSAQLSILAGIVIIIMGLHFLGLTRIGFLMREGRLSIPKPVGLGGAYVMGLAFAFGWTPCIGPILAAILSEAASGERGARNGCIDGADGGRVSDRQHVKHQHLAAGDVSGAAEFRLIRNNSTLRDETPAPYYLDFD